MNPGAILVALSGLQEIISKAMELYDAYKKSIDDSISVGDLKLEDLTDTVQKLKDQGKISKDFTL